MFAPGRVLLLLAASLALPCAASVSACLLDFPPVETSHADAAAPGQDAVGPPRCGNGIQESGEECDGEDLGGATCESLHLGTGQLRCSSDCVLDTTGCRPLTCGNGVVDAPEEECDDGNTDDTDACLSNCKQASCGDGFVWAGHEDCDEGGQDTQNCDSDCTFPSCGDGHTNPAAGEECDDGNTDDTDACLSNCKQASCGDGIVWAGHEDCDEGGQDTQNCDSDCTLPSCGDGHPNPAAGEECDDGNTDDTDACLSNCKQASCGDGIVWAGHEDCDEGGQETVVCDPDCTFPECGDGYLNRMAGEVCDDGNTRDGDGCSRTCHVETYAGCSGDSPSVCHCVVFVDQEATGQGDGSSWANAFTDIRLALAEAQRRAPCDVWVASGHYVTESTYEVGTQGVHLYGSFTPGATWFDGQADVDVAPSVLDGTGMASPVLEVGPSADDFLLDSFVVTGGSGLGLGEAGGIHVWVSTNVTIRNCRIRDNHTRGSGGGIYVDSSWVLVQGCILSGNSAGSQGGGIYAEGASRLVRMEASWILSNEAGEEGGGIAVSGAGGTAEVVNSFLVGNRSSRNVGLNGYVSGAACRLSFLNSDILPDQAQTGTSLEASFGSSMVVTNCILWGNDSLTHLAGNFSVSYSDVQNQSGAGTGVISVDPLFRAPDAQDYDLRPGSPCIDRGDGDVAPPTDALGRPRYDDPDHPNVGRGTPPYVDIGALEFQG